MSIGPLFDAGFSAGMQSAADEIKRLRKALDIIRDEADTVHSNMLTSSRIDDDWEKQLGGVSQFIYGLLGESTDHLAPRASLDVHAGRMRAMLAGTKISEKRDGENG